MRSWMVVEDEPDIYEVLLAMFEMWGIEGVAFVDGEEAIAWIEDVDAGRFKGELPELALLDVRLPGEAQGGDVGARLRKSPVLKDVAIVLTTAYKLPAEEQRAITEKAGADKYLQKPLPLFSELQAMFETIINQRRAKANVAARKPVRRDANIDARRRGEAGNDKRTPNPLGMTAGNDSESNKRNGNRIEAENGTERKPPSEG